MGANAEIQKEYLDIAKFRIAKMKRHLAAGMQFTRSKLGMQVVWRQLNSPIGIDNS